MNLSLIKSQRLLPFVIAKSALMRYDKRPVERRTGAEVKNRKENRKVPVINNKMKVL